MGLKDILKEQLVRHEKNVLKPYRDIFGKWTIGIGRNLDDNGISEEESFFLLNNDLDRCIGTVTKIYPWFVNLSVNRQAVIINMAFNLGIHGLSDFCRMISAIARQDYDDAASEMLDSAWSKEVGNRALELAELMRKG